MNLNHTPTFPETLEYLGTTPMIPTTEYKNIAVERLPEIIENYYAHNHSFIKQLLQGKLDIQKAKEEGGAFSIDTIYPEDAEGNINEDREKNGILRAEELVTFATQDPETGEIYYISRGRPEIPGSNTPGQLDPGVFSHGGLSQAGVINAWRYVADKLGKNDTELTQEEYISYMKEYPFPQDFSIVDTGSFIIANGSNARNIRKKEKGEELEVRTSGLLQVRAIVLSYTDFQKILTEQNASGELPIQYSSLPLAQETQEGWTPKHQAVHELLQAHQKELETQVQKVQEDFRRRIEDSL